MGEIYLAEQKKIPEIIFVFELLLVAVPAIGKAFVPERHFER